MLLDSKIKGLILEERSALVPCGFPDTKRVKKYSKVLVMVLIYKVPKKLFLVLTGRSKKMLRV